MTDQAVGPERPGADREPAAPRPRAGDDHGPRAPDARVPRSRSGTGPPAPLLGRKRELKSLLEDIGRTGLDTLAGRGGARGRILLVAGAPGSGRTALAEEFLATVAGDYPDALLRTRLSLPGGRPVPLERIARELLDRLGEPLAAGAGEDEATEVLRRALATRRAALLLDDAVGADQVHPLVPDSPDCLVLVVSRGPLTGISDVRPCTLGGLERAAATALLTRGAGPTRVTVDPCSAESVAEECEGLPAALELAAGWLATRPMASVSDLLRGLRGVDVPDWPGTGPAPLARAFALTVGGLPHAAARLLRKLSLAPGGLVDAHIASALAGSAVGDAESVLADLRHRGLLRLLPDDGTERRPYQVPGALAPLLQALTTRCERPGEVELARARMLERLVRQLQSCRAMAQPPGTPARRYVAGLPKALRFPSRAAARTWLRGRRPALLEAARDAVTAGGLDTLDRRLTAALTRTLIAHFGAPAAAPDLYELHTLVLGVAERRGLPRERAAALLNLGDLDAQAGRLPDAVGRYRGALDAAREVRDPAATGRALESIGGAYGELGDWQRAADWYGRALELRQTRGEGADEARLHGRLGAVLACASRWDEALRAWRLAAATHRRLGDLAAHARALGEAGRVQECAGRFPDALRTSREALRAAGAAELPRWEAALHLRISDLLERLGDAPGAVRHRELGARLLGEGPESASEAAAGCAEGREGARGATPAQAGHGAAPGGGEVPEAGGPPDAAVSPVGDADASGDAGAAGGARSVDGECSADSAPIGSFRS